MGDTVNPGAESAIGEEGTFGSTSGLADASTGSPFTSSPAADLLNTPQLGVPVDQDVFQSAMTNGSFTPGGFSSVLSSFSNDDDGSDVNLGKATGTREAIVQYAKKFLGTPYVWGGAAPGGFDCSGLVQYVMKKFGVNLPRISYQLANSGKRVPMSQLQAGDLVAWDENSRNPGADHIAIYMGNGYVIEAPHTGANVKIEKVGTKDVAGMWGVHLNIGE